MFETDDGLSLNFWYQKVRVSVSFFRPIYEVSVLKFDDNFKNLCLSIKNWDRVHWVSASACKNWSCTSLHWTNQKRHICNRKCKKFILDGVRGLFKIEAYPLGFRIPKINLGHSGCFSYSRMLLCVPDWNVVCDGTNTTVSSDSSWALKGSI